MLNNLISDWITWLFIRRWRWQLGLLDLVSQFNYKLFYSLIYPANTSTPLLVPRTSVNRGAVRRAETKIDNLPESRSSKLYLRAAGAQNQKEPWGQGTLGWCQTTEEAGGGCCAWCSLLKRELWAMCAASRWGQKANACCCLRQSLERWKEVLLPRCPSSDVPFSASCCQKKHSWQDKQTFIDGRDWETYLATSLTLNSALSTLPVQMGFWYSLA